MNTVAFLHLNVKKTILDIKKQKKFESISLNIVKLLFFVINGKAKYLRAFFIGNFIWKSYIGQKDRSPHLDHPGRVSNLTLKHYSGLRIGNEYCKTFFFVIDGEAKKSREFFIGNFSGGLIIDSEDRNLHLGHPWGSTRACLFSDIRVT